MPTAGLMLPSSLRNWVKILTGATAESAVSAGKQSTKGENKMRNIEIEFNPTIHDGYLQGEDCMRWGRGWILVSEYNNHFCKPINR